MEKLEKKPGRNMSVAIATGVGLLCITIIPLIFFPFIFSWVVVIFAGLGTYELCHVLHRVRRVNIPPYLAAVTACFITASGYYFSWNVTVGLVIIGLIGIKLVGKEQAPTSYVVALLVYVPLLLSFVTRLLQEPWGQQSALLGLIIISISDTAGLFTGMAFGKHKLAPKISPGKTWEGLMGSLIAAIVCSVVLTQFFFPLSWHAAVIFALVVALAATIGDLFESKLKRVLGIKDMSQMIPGHGGVMDRLDSIVFAMPTVYILLFLALHSGMLTYAVH